MDQNLIFEQLLGQQLNDNPQLQAVMTMMQQMKAKRTEETQQASEEEVNWRAKAQSVEVKLRQLYKINKQLAENLTHFQNFQDDMAHALGACPLCWGADNNCKVCRGRGVSGSMDSDPILFEELILPAINRRKTQRKSTPPEN